MKVLGLNCNGNIILGYIIYINASVLIVILETAICLGVSKHMDFGQNPGPLLSTASTNTYVFIYK